MVASAFYCVSDSRYFIGAVALLNSLRLMGHEEPMFVVDAGLTSDQQSLIANHATLVAPADGVPAGFLRPLGPMKYPAGVAILLDADIVVTRPLTGSSGSAHGSPTGAERMLWLAPELVIEPPPLHSRPPQDANPSRPAESHFADCRLNEPGSG